MIHCIECKQFSTIEEWNGSTKEHCGDDIVPIEDVCGDNVKVFFYRPKCNLKNYAFDLIWKGN